MGSGLPAQHRICGLGAKWLLFDFTTASSLATPRRPSCSALLWRSDTKEILSFMWVSLVHRLHRTLGESEVITST